MEQQFRLLKSYGLTPGMVHAQCGSKSAAQQYSYVVWVRRERVQEDKGKGYFMLVICCKVRAVRAKLE